MLHSMWSVKYWATRTTVSEKWVFQVRSSSPGPSRLTCPLPEKLGPWDMYGGGRPWECYQVDPSCVVPQPPGRLDGRGLLLGCGRATWICECGYDVRGRNYTRPAWLPAGLSSPWIARASCYWPHWSFSEWSGSDSKFRTHFSLPYIIRPMNVTL